MKASDGVSYVNKHALDLIDKCLSFDPRKRVSCEEALAHPYFEGLHDDADEPVFKGSLDFEFEYNDKFKVNDVRVMIIEEINRINKANGEEEYDLPKLKAKFG